jgi:hypothetical protein
MADERALDTQWEFVADTVMGGASTGSLTQETIDGKSAHRLLGRVSLDNNGGFVQMATELRLNDAPEWTGLRLTLKGNGQAYDIRLRTSELRRPWHSYRVELTVGRDWRVYDIPFADFEPHRTDIPLNLAAITRLGIVAIGREFDADVAVAGLALYR